MGNLSDDDDERLRKNARNRAWYAKKNEGKPKKITATMEAKLASEQGLIKFLSSVPCRTCGSLERYAIIPPICISCKAQKNKKYDKKYPEKSKEMKKAWYEKNREYCALYQKAKYQLNKSKVKEGDLNE